MTIIRPNRSRAYENFILGGLIICSVLAAFWLVSLYNHLVNARHAVLEMKEEIRSIQTANAELKEKTFSLLDSRKFEELARERGLIEDREPEYFKVDPQWSLASQY